MHQNPNIAAGIIFLVSEVVKEKPDLSTLMTHLMGRSNTRDRSGGGDNSKDSLEVAADNDDNDFSDFKQFGPETKTKGGVYVSMRIESKGKRPVCSREDVPGKGSGEVSSDKAMQITTTTSSSNIELPDNNSKTSHQTSYDPYHRSPQYAGSHNTSLWELRQLEVCECAFYFVFLSLGLLLLSLEGRHYHQRKSPVPPRFWCLIILFTIYSSTHE